MIVEIKLVMDRERAILLLRALEVIARLGMGQFKELAELMDPKMGWDESKEIEVYLKSKLTPELHVNGYNGIRSDKVPQECHVAWDAYQHLRREISWADKGKDWRTDQREWYGEGSMMGVSYDDPMKVSEIPGDFKTERAMDGKEAHQ
jgi:hypothetical protein